MTYWILVGMIACAIVIVLVVSSEQGASVAPDADESESETGQVTARTIRWTAMVDSHSVPAGSPSWPSLVASSRPDLNPTVFLPDSLTVAELRKLVTNEDPAPDLVSFAVGLDDLLAGTSLPDVEEELSRLLQDLSNRGSLCVVGTIPDVSRLELPASEGINAADLGMLTRRWNASIRRVCDEFGCAVVDLFDLSALGQRTLLRDADSGDIGTPLNQQALADRFGRAIDVIIDSPSYTSGSASSVLAPLPEE